MEKLFQPSDSRRSLVALAASFSLVVVSGSCKNGSEGPPFTDSSVDRGPDIPAEDTFLQPVATPLAISSTFGPRWKTSESRYDFHRGIDFQGNLGDQVFAISNGQITGLHPEGSSEFPDGGNTLIVEHALSTPFQWQGTTVDTIYALYLHLNDFLVALGDPVSAGQAIGTMGATGTAAVIHLHFEIRLQTTCSLEYQLANPLASCAQYGFDPHIHPFAFIGGANADNITLDHEQTQIFVVTYEATRGDLDLNELRTDLGTINFNRRTGIDASSTATLDNFDYGWVTIVPIPFASSSQTIRYEFRFPSTPHYVELRDIYGRGVRRTFSN
jgi:murein DD-endopeptidase MepM/ murein hydrolase activator NlpD